MAIITVLPQQNRSGKHISASFKMPTNLMGKFKVLADMPLNELQDTRNNLKIESYISDDNITWRFYAGFTYVGGVFTNLQGGIRENPGFGVNGSEIAGKWIRVEVTLNRQMRIGMNLEY